MRHPTPRRSTGSCWRSCAAAFPTARLAEPALASAADRGASEHIPPGRATASRLSLAHYAAIGQQLNQSGRRNQRPTAKANSQPPADALAAKLKRTELQHSPSSIPGREIVQVLTEIPCGVESGWHIHPGEEVGYILAGTVQMMIQGQPTLTLHAGDPFLMPPRTPHNALDVGPGTGQMLSTYLVETGQPLATFVDGPPGTGTPRD